jgi:UDP-N-acetylglucosamine 2-epimerase (non-hydrolysing)
MKNKIKIILVAGARPNFMKVAPLMHEMKKHDEFKPILVHTGQHYDENMSEKFFKQLGICNPDINLDVGSASHAVQTARIMERFEKVCLNERPDAVLVVGDVNSTAACVLVASKLNIKTIHYEAGLRSRDKSMPEEINRMVTDAICDIFFTTSKDADENLINEGHDKEQIFMYGNLMIDSLVKNLKKAKSVNMEFRTLSGKKIKYGKDFKKKNYGVMTFHRPSNVDDPDKLLKLVNIWGRISEKTPLVFPIHPRTVKNIKEFSIFDRIKSFADLFLIEPAAYLQFINLVRNSRFVLTDSGGIQEETTYLNVPCLTIRPTTERPVTIWEGTNKLIKEDEIINEIEQILAGNGKKGKVPKFWDGNSARRIVEVLSKKFK